VLCAVPARAQAPQSPDAPVIVAQGDATIRQAPDIAWVQIGVEARGSKPEDARQRGAEAMTLVLAVLRQHLPAEALKTSSFSVQPEMEYISGSSRVKGYVARNQVEARVDDLERLSAVMDAGVSSGATSISGMRFDVKARAKLERDALKLAVQDATERAQAIAAGAGRAVGPIVRIQEQRIAGGPVFRAAQSGGGGGRGGAATETPLALGEIEIRAIVVLTVAIK
jgi:uncharacterized protein YggE